MKLKPRAAARCGGVAPPRFASVDPRPARQCPGWEAWVRVRAGNNPRPSSARVARHAAPDGKGEAAAGMFSMQCWCRAGAGARTRQRPSPPLRSPCQSHDYCWELGAGLVLCHPHRQDRLPSPWPTPMRSVGTLLLIHGYGGRPEEWEGLVDELQQHHVSQPSAVAQQLRPHTTQVISRHIQPRGWPTATKNTAVSGAGGRSNRDRLAVIARLRASDR